MEMAMVMQVLRRYIAAAVDDVGSSEAAFSHALGLC
jgi:hypothetical protein